MEKKEKIAFATRDEAYEELIRILETQKKPWKKEDKKPSRIYHEGGYWFLTSSIKITVY